jgi:transcriptional regulator GlxA family with amidase domain
LDVLIVPGGFGTRADISVLGPVIEFIKTTYPSLQYLFTICTGSWLAARAGVLDGKRATSNKRSWAGTKVLGDGKIEWVAHARWVVDGNCWTTSGISAGIDGMLALIQEVYGEESAQDIANNMEYEWHKDPTWDPFADMYGL